VRAIFRKELREYRHNGFIIWTMAIFPLIFLIQPLVVVFLLPPSASSELGHEHLLLYMLGIPALVPAAVAAYAVVGERQQGTLEPVLTTPIRRPEFLLGKALAALVPSVAIAYAVYALFLGCVELFAQPPVASALLRGPDLVAQLLFGNIVPTGLEVRGRTIYMAEAGPVPHLPENGKVVAFRPGSTTPREVASGSPLLVDVEFGRRGRLYAVSQGIFGGGPAGSPARPDTGALVKVNRDGHFTVVIDGLNQPTSLEFIRKTATSSR
jgi:hypothetical protein